LAANVKSPLALSRCKILRAVDGLTPAASAAVFASIRASTQAFAHSLGVLSIFCSSNETPKVTTPAPPLTRFAPSAALPQRGQRRPQARPAIFETRIPQGVQSRRSERGGVAIPAITGEAKAREVEEQQAYPSDDLPLPLPLPHAHVTPP
jgi:hypothetical protein